ncbi:MAG TPA: murein biosynthesis integral membrane protein MurJ [Thermosynechococcaceae cyanobacterium]
MTESPQKPTRSLINIAKVVAIATLISKVFGLVRQQAIAAAFGTGAAYGAYNFAYVIPGFLLILLGGINGPFHSAMVSVLSKRKREDIAPIVDTITTLVVGLLLLVTVGLIVFAEPLIHLVAPGLFITAEQSRAAGQSAADFVLIQQTRTIAIQQFQIMAPMAMLAGLIGIGFGTLNAADQYWLPSISPLFSSVTLLLGLGVLAVNLGSEITSPQNAVLGGAVLAWATLAGAVLQWLVQLPAQLRSNLGGLRLRFNFRQPEVQEVMRVMGPATFSSGMLQINVWTDLFFASFISNAAAAVSAMGYAGLLIQTPLGIVSNVILVPLLPVFSRLAAPENWDELKQRIRQGLILAALTMIPLTTLTIALAVPLSRAVYERYAFRMEDSYLTAAVLVSYASGMFFYLGRDVLVRVFYALGDGDTPFRISIANILLNAVLDYLLLGWGAPGLVFATVIVNVVSMFVMLGLLHRRLNGLPLRSLALPTVGLASGSGVAGLITWGVLLGCRQWLGDRGLLVLLAQLVISGTVGLSVVAVVATQLRLPEVDLLVDRLRQRFSRRE